jgi:hypothetical protein
MLGRVASRVAVGSARPGCGAGRASAELATAAAARQPAARAAAARGAALGGAALGGGPRAVAARALQRLGQSCLELSLALRAAPPRAGLVLNEDDGEPFEGPRLPVP